MLQPDGPIQRLGHRLSKDDIDPGGLEPAFEIQQVGSCGTDFGRVAALRRGVELRKRGVRCLDQGGSVGRHRTGLTAGLGELGKLRGYGAPGDVGGTGAGRSGVNGCGDGREAGEVVTGFGFGKTGVAFGMMKVSS
jgi:hypothetical protein